MSRSRKSPARVDNSCRNHGSCPWCVGNRLHKHRKADGYACAMALLKRADEILDDVFSKASKRHAMRNSGGSA